MPFPYKSDRAVLWKYSAQGPDGRQDASVMHVRNDMPAARIMNISGMSDMTRSGRIFAPPELPARSKDKGKAKADTGEDEPDREWRGPCQNVCRGGGRP